MKLFNIFFFTVLFWHSNSALAGLCSGEGCSKKLPKSASGSQLKKSSLTTPPRTPYQPSACSNKCPNGRTPVPICFTSLEGYSTSTWRAAAASNCGSKAEIVIADKLIAMEETFHRLANECKSIDRMVLNGHGSDGNQVVGGGINSRSVQELKEFGCLFEKNAEIHFVGCNVGRGCKGDMLFLKAAQNLLPKGGTITGNTFYASSFFPWAIPHFSLNGKGRKLTYKPNQKPADSWTQTGLAISDGGNINQRCAKELGDLIEDYSGYKKQAQEKGCSSSYDLVRQSDLAAFSATHKRLKQSPPYLNSPSPEVWESVRRAVVTMQNQNSGYESCEPDVGSDNADGVQ